MSHKFLPVDIRNFEKMITENFVVVVFTEPVKDTIRIISARKANRSEQERYHEKAMQNRLGSFGIHDG